MTKLLCAGLSRLKRDRVLWLMTGVYLAICVYTAAAGSETAAKMLAAGYDITADYYMSDALPLLGLFLAVVVSLFLGTEYADGTVRNKLIMGHRRRNVYLANYVTSLAGGMALMLAWLLGVFPWVFSGAVPLGTGAGELGLHLAVIAMTVAAFTAIYTLIGTLNTNKAYAAVTTLAVFFLMMLFVAFLYGQLSEPEFHPEYARMTETGELQVIPAGENPKYLGGWERKVCLFLVRLLPTGQIMLFTDLSLSRELGLIQPGLQLLLSAALILALTLAGMWFFRRKDLK